MLFKNLYNRVQKAISEKTILLYFQNKMPFEIINIPSIFTPQQKLWLKMKEDKNKRIQKQLKNQNQLLNKKVIEMEKEIEKQKQIESELKKELDIVKEQLQFVIQYLQPLENQSQPLENQSQPLSNGQNLIPIEELFQQTLTFLTNEDFDNQTSLKFNNGNKKLFKIKI